MGEILYTRRTLAGEIVENRKLEPREPKPLGFGDKIERIANLIPGVKSLPCHDRETKRIKPDSPCGRAKARLNAGEPIIPTLIRRIAGR